MIPLDHSSSLAEGERGAARRTAAQSQNRVEIPARLAEIQQIEDIELDVSVGLAQATLAPSGKGLRTYSGPLGAGLMHATGIKRNCAAISPKIKS